MNSLEGQQPLKVTKEWQESQKAQTNMTTWNKIEEEKAKETFIKWLKTEAIAYDGDLDVASWWLSFFRTKWEEREEEFKKCVPREDIGDYEPYTDERYFKEAWNACREQMLENISKLK